MCLSRVVHKQLLQIMLCMLHKTHFALNVTGGACPAIRSRKHTAALEHEKKLMQTVAVADNDVANLNVGGSLLSTKKCTLTQVCIKPVANAERLP